MKQGQFWSIPLKNGNYACGIVLSLVLEDNGKRNSRTFLAGLLDWKADSAPSSESIRNSAVIRMGFAHIKTITAHGREILGEAEINNEFPEAIRDTDHISTWGYSFINLLAEDL
jgi:hypothetical protein